MRNGEIYVQRGEIKYEEKTRVKYKRVNWLTIV